MLFKHLSRICSSGPGLFFMSPRLSHHTSGGLRCGFRAPPRTELPCMNRRMFYLHARHSKKEHLVSEKQPHRKLSHMGRISVSQTFRDVLTFMRRQPRHIILTSLPIIRWQTLMVQLGLLGLGNACKGSWLCPTKADELEGNPK